MMHLFLINFFWFLLFWIIFFIVFMTSVFLIQPLIITIIIIIILVIIILLSSTMPKCANIYQLFIIYLLFIYYQICNNFASITRIAILLVFWHSFGPILLPTRHSYHTLFRVVCVIMVGKKNVLLMLTFSFSGKYF